MKRYVSPAQKKVMTGVAVLLVLVLGVTAYTLIGKNSVISEQEFRTLVENWQVLADSEFYHLMVKEDNQKLGLWNLEGYSRKNDNFLDERLRFMNPDKMLDFEGKMSSSVSKFGLEFTYGNEDVYLSFQLIPPVLLPYSAYRHRVEDMLMLVEQGIDTQWSIILPDLIQKSKSGSTQTITIENANYGYIKEFPKNTFVLSSAGILENSADASEPILAEIPSRELIGASAETVASQFGESHIYVAARHQYPAYVTQDAKLVLFITNEDVVERILVFDLLDKDCKLVQTIS